MREYRVRIVSVVNGTKSFGIGLPQNIGEKLFGREFVITESGNGLLILPLRNYFKEIYEV